MFAGENVTLWVKHFLEKTSAVHALIKESTVFQQLPTSAIKVIRIIIELIILLLKFQFCIKLHNPGICIQSVKQCTNTPEQEIPFTKTTSITCKPL